MNEVGEGKGSPETKEFIQRRVDGYRDWLKTLEQHVQRGILTSKKRDTTVARAMAARDLVIERNREKTMRDPLTNLLNRRGFEKKYHQRTEQGRPFGLLMLDIDYFKRVNDEHGHIAGDKVLIQVGLILINNLRELREEEDADVIARVGGEEFAIILPGVNSEENLRMIAERLRQSLCEDSLIITVAGEDKAIKATMSIGGGLYRGEDRENFLNRIDKEALYQAKERGRNRSVILPVV